MEDKSKYRVNIDELVAFIFPSTLQHPLVSGRLYAFGDCGPLDEGGHLRSGFKGKHVVMDYELDEMCVQYEREDVIQIYLHRPSDMGSLSVAEEEMIIGQADGHLKKAKGRAMLPRLTQQDVYQIFEDLPRDADGTVSFHDAQKRIAEFRRERIARYKLVFPNLGNSKAKASSSGAGATTGTGTGTGTLAAATATGTGAAAAASAKMKSSYRVSEAVAPPSMFQKMKGNTYSDLIEQTTKMLSKHAYRIGDGAAQASDMSANVRLLRSDDPRRQTQRMAQGSALVPWNDTCTVKGTGVGSKVEAAASSTTWKRNTTVY